MPLPWWPSSLSSCSTPDFDERQRERHRRLTRAKQLRHLRDQDIKDLDVFYTSDSIDHDNRDFLQCASHRPQPLPLPDLSTAFASSDRFVRQESKLAGYRFRLPAPNEGDLTPSCSYNSENASIIERERARAGMKEKEKEGLVDQFSGRFSLQDGRYYADAQRNVDVQRNVDARCSVDVRRAAGPQLSPDHAETWSSMKTNQKIRGMDRAQGNFSIDVHFRSAPTTVNSSPMLSPQRMWNPDIFPLSPGESNPLSDPAKVSGFPYSAVPEITMISREYSPFQSPPMKSHIPARRSTGGSPSPRRPKLSIEVSHLLHHPLPLPPPLAYSAQTSPACQVAPRPEFLQVKDQWTKGKLIGRGTFGSVYIATNRETGALCAMKEVELFPDDPKSAECIRQLEQEIKVLSQLKHPNIVQYYGSEIVDDRFFIYLEYVYPGSINKYVREHCGAVTEAVVRNFTRHILSGLAFLHVRKTIHRDIKGANLLVDSSGVVKLADFGMAKHLTGQAAELSLKGSPYWMAPELMQAVMQKEKNSDLAYAIDIWSLGCTIIEMLTGKPPWSDYEGVAAMFKVLKESPPVPETLSPEGKDFLQCCFRRNPAERPPASKLLEHPFLRNSQHLDISSSSPELNINLLYLRDRAPSPTRDIFDHKLDKMPSPGGWKPNGKGVNNETSLLSHVETPDLTVLDFRHSPRSTLESATSSSPTRSVPSQNIPAHSIRITLSKVKKALSARFRK